MSAAVAGAMLDDLRDLVACESPSADTHATARCAAEVDRVGAARLGERAARLNVAGRTHLRWTFGRPRVLLLGHLDTVWPLGTLARWPFRVDGEVASGPGVFDMKAGLVQLFAALAGRSSLDGVDVLVTSDEELGSPSSAALIEEAARAVRCALVLEPSEGGALKTARKGVGQFRIDVTGRAAHAGLAPESGVNATVEAAHQVLAVAALADPARGTTVSPTVLSSGSAVNTVPAAAVLAVDVRTSTVAEMDRVAAALRALTPHLAEATVHVRPDSVRPPLEETASAELFRQAQEVAGRLGLPPLRGVAVGGGSDGNLTAAAGVPTLDGLGAVGGNAHAEGEWVSLPAMAERARLLAALLDELLEES